jgi:hypothetical protein
MPGGEETYGEAPASLSYIPADSTLVAPGTDLTAQLECVAGTGFNVPSGTTRYGFVDTTYLPTQAQILAETTQGVS